MKTNNNTAFILPYGQIANNNLPVNKNEETLTTRQLQYRVGSLKNQHLPVLREKNGTKILPFRTEVDEAPLHKNSNGIPVSKPFINAYMKEMAARLSEIDLAIANYDAMLFYHSAQSLINLFDQMNLPAAIQMTRLMEELAGENKLEEARDQMQNIKVMIALFVKTIQNVKSFKNQ